MHARNTENLPMSSTACHTVIVEERNVVVRIVQKCIDRREEDRLKGRMGWISRLG
jgi:hypothetical protein